MFVGHIALALASKPSQPKVSLGWLVAAVEFADILWPVFLLLGIERVRIAPGATAFTPLDFVSYPWSHSLLMLIVWGVVLGAIARWRGVPRTGAVLIALLVVSHWVLDVIAHAPDMPLWPGSGSPKLGLGLWNSVPATIGVEGLMWIAGIVIYLRRARAAGAGTWVLFWSFVAISTLLWISGPWTPPPPSAQALAWAALIGWILVPWAAWADRGFSRPGSTPA
jgi:membrane-bound metal-dependent hydrolase YbcI (DUF457 family)